jgi:hypothetical protein
MEKMSYLTPKQATKETFTSPGSPSILGKKSKAELDIYRRPFLKLQKASKKKK